MGRIKTHDLMDVYFATLPPTTVTRIRRTVDRPELYAYEEEIGKEFIDMNEDEIANMIMTFSNQRAGNKSLSYLSVVAIISWYKKIFKFYIDNYELIRNPMDSKRIRAMASSISSPVEGDRIDIDLIDRTIAEIRSLNENCEDRADYLECIILLFYNGLASGEDIARVKADMVHPDTNEIDIGRAVLTVSPRCMELFEKVSRMRTLPSKRSAAYGDPMFSWQNSFFRFAVRGKTQDDFDQVAVGDISRMINNQLKHAVNGTSGAVLNYQNIYYLGFYHYIIEQCGEARAKEIITSVNSIQATDELDRYMLKYGVIQRNTTKIKRKLLAYV